MQIAPNDFVITVATVNGSGSQSANNVLVRSLFRMGIPVGEKIFSPRILPVCPPGLRFARVAVDLLRAKSSPTLLLP